MEVRFGKQDRFWRSDSGASVNAQRSDLVQSLYATHRPALLRFLSKRTNCAQEAEDLSQEVFIRLLNLNDVERIRDNARNFMYQVAANIACDNFRRAKVRRKNFHVPICDYSLAADTPSPERELEIAQSIDAIEEILSTLRRRERRAFRLHFERDLTYAEVAGEIGVTTRTIERWMARIKKLIQSAQVRSDTSVPMTI